MDILVKGASFETKVLQALDIYMTTQPRAAQAYRAEIKDDRKRLKRSSGMESGDDGQGIGAFGGIPPFVGNLLSMSEFATTMMYGKPCGTGDKLWHTRPGLYEAFFRVCSDGKLSSMNSLPRTGREEE